ncbi:phage tail assembly protein, partial [Escherichia coli]
AAQMAKLDIFKTSMQILRFFTQSETESTSGNDSTMSPGSGS